MRLGPRLRSWLVPGVAVLVAGAALVFQSPQLVSAIAHGCVTPGLAGPNPTLTGVVNTYYPATASAAAAATSISVGAPIGAAPAIAPGDLLLVIQMQDADINNANTVAYGDGATGRGSTALRSTGLYEYVAATTAVVAGVVTISGSGAGNGLVNSYDFSNVVTATHGFRTFQVIRVPQYSSATVTAGLTASPWNGALHAGGVLAIDVAGALNLNAQTISVNQLGFKGSQGVPQTGPTNGATGTDYVRPTGNGQHGYKGEGIAGTPHFLYDAIAGAAANVAADGYPSGDAARGAPGNGGGGGTDSHPSDNAENSGGGGGGNGGQGGLGGNTWNTNLPVGGLGGATFPAAVTKVVLGGGGGAGSRNNSAGFASSGGTGGGIVMIRTGSLVGAGTITANGGVGVTPQNDGGGGGGAGGSVVVTSNTGTVNGLTIHADGGNGTNAWPTGPTGAGNYHGPGGGGGGGVIITSNALPLAQTTVAGGAHGTTTVDANTYGSFNGNAGLVLTTTPGAIPGSSSGAECLPALTVTKTTTTPNVTNTVAGTTATYSITVSNAANTAAATSVNVSDALPAGFSYASTGGVVLNGGATRPATVNPAPGDTSPIFGTFTIPASASVVITFTVNVAASVAPGTYNNPATATYLDPTRTTLAGTTSVTYPGGGAERVTVHAPDMTIAKSHVDPLVRGSATSTYTLTATNSGNVATIGTVTVTDTLPAGLTPTGAAGPGWTCPAPVGQTVTCTRSDVLAAGSSYPPITVTVTVLQTAPNSVTNTASVGGGGESNTTNDTATDLTNVVSRADIAVTKTVSNATPNQNTNVTFTITTTNNGPSNATGVQVTDLLPAGLTLVSAAPSGVTTYSSVTGVWNIGALTNGANATLSLVATVTGTTAVTNTATKTAETETDPVAGNNSASATVTGQAADIAITKTVSNATPNLGTNVTFTITATNNGPSNATGVQVTDLLPGGLVFVSATPSGATTYNSGTGLWDIGAIANGANATLSIVATVNTTIATTNTATKTAENQFDPVAGNNSASATVTGQAADIAITKTVSNATPNFGSNVTFTVTATNIGPSAATGVQVTDLLPAGLTYVSSVPSGVTTYTSGTGVWNIGSLANGAGATLTITATVNTTAATTNTATKTAEIQPDPVAGNNSASAVINPVAADIAVTKSVSNTRPNQSTNVTFTITATNNGPSNATGVQVTDLLPAGLTYISSVPSGATTYTSGTGVWNIGPLANGANATLSIVATVTGTNPVTNTASKTAEVQPDSVAGNNTASVVVTGQAADIAITKTVDTATPNLGANVTFTVTATNNGPSDATGVQVTDTLPAGLTFVSATPSAGTTYNSGTGVWNIGALTNATSATLAITATVTTTTPIGNTATKSAEDQPDPVAGNNTATVLVTPVSADIAITKSVDNPTPPLGSNITYTVTAHNNGPSNATGVQVTDVLPAGLTYFSSAPSQGTYNSGTGLWDVGAIANGGTATLSIVATVNVPASITNTATKTAEAQPDPVAGNDSASATSACCIADIAVTKSVSNATPNFGSNVTFTVTAINNGPHSASGLLITDQLPAGLTFFSSAPSAGTSYSSVTGIWNIGNLANAASATLGLTATVNTTSPTTNTATKTGENEADSTAGDDSASVSITPVAADIAITKTVSNTTPNQNTNVTFTITATNNGPSSATGLQVTDLLPAGLTFVSSVPSGATSYNSVTGVWTIGALANGGNATLSIVATVTGTATVTNTAAKTAETQPDPVPGNNSASANVTGEAADIAVAKIVDNATPNLGSTVTFTIAATNFGPSNATGVEITDALPPGLTFVSAAPSVGTYISGTGIWHIGPLANGATANLSIVATATSTAATINTATRTAGNQPDPNAANDSASVTVTGQQADIGVTKSVNNATPDFGTNVTYTVTATNHGPSNATGVQVTDLLPGGLLFVSATPSVPTTYNSGSGLWDIGPLANGASATLSIVATVNTTAPTTNTATKTLEVQPDPVAGNNTASAGITPRSVADIAIAKSVSSLTPNFGSNVTFTVTATNSGPQGATGVQVTDLMPAGLTFFSATPSGATTYNSGTGVWNIGPIANGANATLSIVATVNTTSPVTNTATKTAENEDDSTAGDDSASATITPVAADIAITKTVSNAAPNQNTDVTFTITATNNGPSNATGVQVSDLLPGGLTFVSAAPSGATTYDSVTGLWNIGALANGGNATLSIVATVTGTTLVTNTATRTAAVQPDPVAGNNAASASVTGQAADIAIAKTVSNPTPNLGTSVTFTVTATNIGPNNATGVQVTDLLPAGLTFVSAIPSGVTTYNSGTGVWNIGAVANGANATLSIVATVNTNAATTNTATKTAEDQTDPVAGNNSATAIVTGQSADIAVTKTVSNPIPNQGNNVTFTVTATNNGPSNATGVQVTDLLPAGLTYVSSVPSGATTYNSGTGVWNIGALANGANSTLSIVAGVTGNTLVTNTATRTAEDQPDPVAGNNSASANVTGQAADIGVTKIVDNATPNLGTNVTFTVTATNNGPSSATGIVVTDLLPAGLTFVSALPSVGTYTSGTGVWNIGGLTNGSSATLSLVATVTTTATTTNIATKTGEVQPDPVAGNDSSSVAVTGQAADIAIAKTVSNATPNLNTNVTFTVTATNNGPSNATGVQVSDVLPAGLVFVSAAPGVGTYNSGTGAWNIGTIANGANATLSIVATVNTTVATTNTATKTAEDQTDPVAGNNTASVTVTGQAADIAITKTVSNATPDWGTNVTFTITAANNGPGNATGVQVTDLLPAGLTYFSSVPSGATTYNSGTGIWDIGALANGAGATLTITATVNTTAAATNTATKTAENQPDLVAGNNAATAVITPVSADIAVAKTVSNSVPNVGTNVTFTITATNNGPSNATGVQVTDLLPGSLTYISSVASTGTYTSGTGVWNIGALTNGTGATLSIVATVTTSSLTTNTATRTAEVEPDPVAGNNSASATVSPQAADIAITKTVSNATPNFGSNVTFTITATNTGPSNATGLQVTDSLPAGLTYVSSVPSGATTYNPGSGIWDIGALANGANATLSITATINTTAGVTNTATKTAENQPDPGAGNNSAGATVTPVSADIAIAKSVNNPTPVLGTDVTFTITASNSGPSNATGVQVTDVLPATLTFVSAAPSQGTYNSGTGLWNVGAIVNGAGATLNIVATVTGLANSVNTATKTAEDQPDPVTSNDSASSRVACCVADMAVTKTVSNPTPNLGSNVTFIVTATNNGPSDATGLQLTDQLPAGLTFVSAVASVGAYSSVTGIWNIGALVNASSATLSITATVNTLASTTNTARVTALLEADNTAGDDSASATINPVAADIAITKTVSNTMPNQNTDVTFTITATNNGPSIATGVQVTDLLPAGLTYVSSVPGGGTTYNPVTGLWNIGAVANGGNQTLSIVATVTGTTPVTNTATKTAEVQSDPVPGNNTASATATGQSADIAITKTASSSTAPLGSNVTFLVTARNNGPSAASGVQVTDTLPAGLTLVSATPSAGTAYNAGTGVWNIGALANGANATLSIVATVNTTAARTNTATKSAEDQTDSTPGDDTASVTVTGLSADVSVTKTVNNATPSIDQNVTYTIVAHNLGPSTAVGVSLSDLLPAGVTFVSYTGTQGAYNAATGIWFVGTMVNGSTVSLSIVVKVVSMGTIVNTVTILPGGYFDPNLSNNVASATMVPDPALPDTSAPGGGAQPVPAGRVAGLLLTILTLVAVLGIFAMAGIASRHRSAYGRRRSRSRQRRSSPGRFAVGLVAVALSLGIASLSVGEVGSYTSSTVASAPTGTQLIGGKVVDVVPPEPPAPPKAETFNVVAGAITPSRLRIPTIGVDAWVGGVGLRSNGAMDAPDNLWTASWLSIGPKPGQAGNAVIAGHRGVGSPALFSHLENVQAGDKIYVSDAAGNERIYVVTGVEAMDLSRATQAAVFNPTTVPQLVLITCFGRFLNSTHTYDHRLVVFSQTVS